MAALQWRVDSRGNHVADGLVRRYTVAFEISSSSVNGAGVYQVRVDGYPIGTAPTEPAGKAIAQAHNDR